MKIQAGLVSKGSMALSANVGLLVQVEGVYMAL